MTEPSLQLGNGNWAGKSGNLLAYHKSNNNFYADDLTFARASTGTYTDKDGYIQEMPYNKLQYSEQFDNAVWQKAASSVVSGFTSFDGNTNAFKLIEDSANAWHKVFDNSAKPSLTLGTSVTMSIFAKSAERDIIKLTPYIGTKYIWANFNLSTGSVGLTEGTETSTQIENFGNGWYKCSISFVASATNVQSHYSLAESNGTGLTYQGDGTSGIYIYGAQLNAGSNAKTYFPTTTRLNMPRVDYLNNSNGSLILEPQRTNLLNYSSDFSQSYYTKSQVTITSNDTTSPDGTQNSDKVVETTNNSEHIFYRTGISTIGTISIYAKADNSGRLFQIRRDAGTGTNSWAWFNLDNGTVESEDAGVASIESLSNNWYRCIFTPTNASGTIVFSISNGATTRSVSYEGNGTSGVYIYGAQLEQGNYPTSYIPTTGTTVTRIKDTSSTTGLSDVINSEEGVLFAEIAALADDLTYRSIGLNSGSATNRLLLTFNNVSNNINFLIQVGGVTQVNINYASAEITSKNKIALKYKANDFALWINGEKVAIDTSGSTFSASTLNKISFDNAAGADNFYGKVKNLQIFKTALTDTELETLTT